jgi:hypothetical protein
MPAGDAEHSPLSDARPPLPLPSLNTGDEHEPPFRPQGQRPCRHLEPGLRRPRGPDDLTCQVNAGGQAFTNTDVTITLEVESTNFAWGPAANIAIDVLVETSPIAVAGIGIDSFSNIVGSRSRHV